MNPRKKVNQITSYAARKSPRGRTQIATVLVVIALPEERNYFHTVVSNRVNWTATEQRQHFECEYLSQYGQVRVVVRTLEGMGHVEAILGAASAITAVNPQLAVMVGIAGSLDPTIVSLGDVVVSNQAKYYASDKVLSIASNSASTYILVDQDQVSSRELRSGGINVDIRDRFMSNSILRYERKCINVNAVDALLSSTERILKGCNLSMLDVACMPAGINDLTPIERARKVHWGWLLGSNHVVDSLEYRNYLVEKNECLVYDIHRQKQELERVPWQEGKLLAADMESYGFLRAVEKLRTTHAEQGGCPDLHGGVVIRGISDLCADKGFLDRNAKENIRKTAAVNATEVPLTFVENLNYESLVRS